MSFRTICAWTLLVCTAGVLACGGSTGVSVGVVVPLSGTMKMNAAGSMGDLFTYTLDFDALTYTWQGIEGDFAGQERTGTLTHLAEWGDRVYATEEGDSIIVLPDELLLLQTPDGHILGGVPQLATDYAPGEIAGTYNYVWWNGLEFGYGVFHLDPSGIFYMWVDANGVNAPALGTEDESGTWADQGTGVIYADAGDDGVKDYNVMLHPSGAETILVVDCVTNPGLALGVRQRPAPNADGMYSVLSSDAVSVIHVSVAGNVVTTPEGSLPFAPDDPWLGFARYHDDTPGDEWDDHALFCTDGIVFGGGWDVVYDWFWVAIQEVQEE